MLGILHEVKNSFHSAGCNAWIKPYRVIISQRLPYIRYTFPVVRDVALTNIFFNSKQCEVFFLCWILLIFLIPLLVVYVFFTSTSGKALLKVHLQENSPFKDHPTGVDLTRDTPIIAVFLNAALFRAPKTRPTWWKPPSRGWANGWPLQRKVVIPKAVALLDNSWKGLMAMSKTINRFRTTRWEYCSNAELHQSSGHN